MIVNERTQPRCEYQARCESYASFFGMVGPSESPCTWRVQAACAGNNVLCCSPYPHLAACWRTAVANKTVRAHGACVGEAERRVHRRERP